MVRIELPQGPLNLLILKTVALGPQRGRGISELSRQVSAEFLQVQWGGVRSTPQTGTLRIGPFEAERVRQQPAG